MNPGLRQSPHEHDSELLNAIACGDRRALEELYLGYHRRLARFLSRLAPRYESIEEIINDTFMVVWQRAAEFRGASRVSTWIIGIAYRIALKSFRRSDALSRAQCADDLPEHSVEPTQDAELRDWVAQAMLHLSLEQRLTMELAYNLGHSIEEIAQITGCPIGTVKARMFHAREKLRRFLPVLGGISESEIVSNVRSL
ncbi:MAG TPA: sigma-70 family RNA polymerase sigma factor [Steroidobacteraceae bacterium]|jgi:RNA polymerase sigma-70 factor (ECF subfamily)|nr:sigma-70 family RNA polymerase sigma factor [Steroidobacteraceae bacterium]